jgi:hypothetical protein
MRVSEGPFGEPNKRGNMMEARFRRKRRSDRGKKKELRREKGHRGTRVCMEIISRRRSL